MVHIIICVLLSDDGLDYSALMSDDDLLIGAGVGGEATAAEPTDADSWTISPLAQSSVKVRKRKRDRPGRRERTSELQAVLT